MVSVGAHRARAQTKLSASKMPWPGLEGKLEGLVRLLAGSRFLYFGTSFGGITYHEITMWTWFLLHLLGFGRERSGESSKRNSTCGVLFPKKSRKKRVP